MTAIDRVEVAVWHCPPDHLKRISEARIGDRFVIAGVATVVKLELPPIDVRELGGPRHELPGAGLAVLAISVTDLDPHRPEVAPSRTTGTSSGQAEGNLVG